ncbi:MAG: hypothetical protein WA738_19675 [Candidatus Angelobacter sp.]
MDYYTEENPPKCPIQEWLRAQGKRVLIALDATIGTLEGEPDWDDPEVLEVQVF